MKKKVLRNVIIAMLCAVLSVALAACGNDAAPQEAAPPAEQPEEATTAEETPEADVVTEDVADRDGPIHVVYIPKLVGIPWFNLTEDGFVDYANEFGTITFEMIGPAEADPIEQARVFDDVVAQNPDVIIVMPNDTAVLEQGFIRAREAGIVVISHEARDAENVDGIIDFLIMEKTGQQYMEALAIPMDGEGGFAIMVGALTVASHMARADYAVRWQEEHFPDMYQVTSRVEGSECIEEARRRTHELILAHPDLRGILYIGSNGALGGAAAIRELGLVGEFVVAGTSIPSQVKPFMQDGAITTNLIGNPRHIAFATAYIVDRFVNDGIPFADITEVPFYGATLYDGHTLMFHSDAEVTYENADEFGF